MKAKSKKIIGLTALGTLAVVDLAQLQEASATPATFNGPVVTEGGGFGANFQVSIIVDGGRITAVNTPVRPTTGNNSSYATRAIPTLTAEALAAQSANIQGVGGASYTSAAWKQSLAGAIAAAGSAIGVQAPPPPPPTQSATQSATTPPVTNPTTVATNTSATPAPSSSGCATMPPITTDLPDVTSAPTPSGTATPVGIPTASGQATPIRTVRPDNGGSTRTPIPTVTATVYLQQTYVQNNVQTQVQTVTKSQVKTQIITCTYTATPTATPTVTVTATDAAFVIKPGAGVVLKSFVCSKLVMGKLVKKTFKAKVVKCPTGYKLVKK